LIIELLQFPSEKNERPALLFAIQSDPTASKGKFSFLTETIIRMSLMKRNKRLLLNHVTSQTMRRKVTNNAGQVARQQVQVTPKCKAAFSSFSNLVVTEKLNVRGFIN
jgi:hypothetical protein